MKYKTITDAVNGEAEKLKLTIRGKLGRKAARYQIMTLSKGQRESVKEFGKRDDVKAKDGANADPF